MTSGILRPGEGRSAWVVGDLYTVKAGGEDTGGAFAPIEVLVPSQSGPLPHRHRREDEAFYVMEGEFEVHNSSSPARAPGSRSQGARSTTSRTSARRPRGCSSSRRPPGWIASSS